MASRTFGIALLDHLHAARRLNKSGSPGFFRYGNPSHQWRGSTSGSSAGGGSRPAAVARQPLAEDLVVGEGETFDGLPALLARPPEPGRDEGPHEPDLCQPGSGASWRRVRRGHPRRHAAGRRARHAWETRAWRGDDGPCSRLGLAGEEGPRDAGGGSDRHTVLPRPARGISRVAGLLRSSRRSGRDWRGPARRDPAAVEGRPTCGRPIGGKD